MTLKSRQEYLKEIKQKGGPQPVSYFCETCFHPLNNCQCTWQQILEEDLEESKNDPNPSELNADKIQTKPTPKAIP